MPKTASIYRMVMPEHICPYGLKAKYLLEREGYRVEDHWLKTRAETDAFQHEQGVETTPQIFVDGGRIGGYDDLRRRLGRHVAKEGETSYRPVIVIFTVTLMMALAIGWLADRTVDLIPTIERFIAVAMCLLGVQKLQDVESFSTMFLNYDLLARRWVPYGYIYPYAETIAGVLMLSASLVWIAAPISMFIGLVGTVSVFKAVYVDRRELKCACVGGSSSVPLGIVSLTESLMMLLIGIWMSWQFITGLVN